ncbi:hypothetical protein IU485_27860 [Nocardia cyriacigeorgica]|uniref:hypothetical protein n=1 Tax=Nocardia cyriacigeorgica TaxID=135487 RepID=UPI001892D35D|nr:hypothetical protein [Nocardia cyriacigeorgica]MBF6085194.1 hypothetical protein [Nocardia cyriacigeorgica]
MVNSVEKYRIEVPGRDRDVVVVGYVHGFPTHPERGTPLTAFLRPDAELGDADAVALVSVDHATEVTTFDVSTGTSSTRYSRSFLGIGSRGVHWSLRPAEVNEANGGCWSLAMERFAAGCHEVALPERVQAMAEFFRQDVPSTPIKIFDYSLDEEARRERARREQAGR